MRKLMWVLWPSFLVAGAAEAVFFTLFDPADLVLLGHHLEWSRTAVYSAGFFLFWLLAAASSALTCLLQGSIGEKAMRRQAGDAQSPRRPDP